MDNVILTAAHRQRDVESRHEMARMAAENLVAMITGAEPPNLSTPRRASARPPEDASARAG